MKVETNDPRPPYVQVADGLRRAIQSGELSAGTKLPSGRELANEWGVALMTLQKAIDQLRVEGLVYTQRGRGVFVASRDGAPPTDDLSALREVVEELRRRLDVVEARLGSNDGAST
ncbi:GntR family transcriptional regulator [Kribbella sp. VKM Ac-2566]|uniref:GntR family transcriptional regulator n=1 Tax=Kribbella sp. VKM Ac-2566 TaxID=2512218 RepID=UPI001062B58D|nr:GntR family transcriptional regulator [Kribbella sp. VKM Ac-2566]TDW91100.1 regulatory GntR family protein [Kribbella sp. VKM Ac-2566]